jgi:hypothetical protein
VRLAALLTGCAAGEERMRIWLFAPMATRVGRHANGGRV